MAVVYLARDRRLDRDVAIKCLPDEFTADEERLRRFRREAKLLASLNHPNIATGSQGRPEEGIEQLEHLRDSGLRVGDAGGDLGWAYAEAGRRDDALAEMALLEERAAVEFVPNIAFARIHAGLRDDEQTIEWLERAVEAREAVLPLIWNEPHFRHLHAHPRFVEIVDRIGLSH